MLADARPRILLVDDEPGVLFALQDQLEDSFDVCTTERAEDALELVDQEPGFAVVMSDQRMPRMQGDELLTKVRDRCDAIRILCSGYVDMEALTRCVNEGRIYAYLTKPWDNDALRAKLQDAVDQFRAARDLVKSHQLFDALLDSVPHAIFFKDLEQRHLRASPAFLRLVGCSDEGSVQGKRLSELCPDWAFARELEALERRMLLVGGPRHESLGLVDRSGRRVDAQLTLSVVHSREGRVHGIVGVSQDLA